MVLLTLSPLDLHSNEIKGKPTHLQSSTNFETNLHAHLRASSGAMTKLGSHEAEGHLSETAAKSMDTCLVKSASLMALTQVAKRTRFRSCD